VDYKRIVHARDKVCLSCGSSNRLTVHHVKPKCQGGPNTPENCILLCQICHRNLHKSEGYPTGRRPKKRPKRRKRRR
jgi:5-methylcytosine-specific restriction endonuclease McrA